jgi:hypothetical protein
MISLISPKALYIRAPWVIFLELEKSNTQIKPIKIKKAMDK